MIIKIVDGSPVQYSYWHLKQEIPNLVIPEVVEDSHYEEWGVLPCEVDPVPDFDKFSHTCGYGDFYQTDDGAWHCAWSISRMPEEIAVRNTREERNRLLQESDWTQLADAPVDSAAWAEYRQQLRDLPQQQGFPYSVVWPTEPTS